jgi:hypothetical protein
MTGKLDGTVLPLEMVMRSKRVIYVPFPSKIQMKCKVGRRVLVGLEMEAKSKLGGRYLLALEIIAENKL